MSDRPPEVCPFCKSAMHEYADGSKSEFFYHCGTDNTPNHKQSMQCILNCANQQIADLTAQLQAAQGKLAEIEAIARKAIDAARHYPLWSWTDVEAELAECEKQLEAIHPNPPVPYFAGDSLEPTSTPQVVETVDIDRQIRMHPFSSYTYIAGDERLQEIAVEFFKLFRENAAKDAEIASLKAKVAGLEKAR